IVSSPCGPAEIRVYEQEVIVVPIVLLSSFVFTLVLIFLLRFCPEKVDRIRPKASKSTPRRVLQGIDGEILETNTESSLTVRTIRPLWRSWSGSHQTSFWTFWFSCSDSADASERHSFLGFASFLAQLGPHPFLPELLGVVSLRAPLVTVVEELENRDLLSFLWRCRQVGPSSSDTANVRNPQVYIYRKTKISVNELLQFHQRGKTLKKPSNCSNALYAVIKGCCQWKDQDRPTLAEVGRKLASAEKSASDKVLKAGGPVNIERYLQEAGYGETNSYTVF
uniref:Tyrosine-protein kinase catalytic domain-containing protein n=1 Tax=Acanthochromis polyacanthus TaxID=80966 RepID=A0A3Q1FSV5_9TELE